MAFDHASPASAAPPIVVRGPEPADAPAIWRLVVATGVLDVNSPYAYLLVCSHFAGTSVVATSGDDLVGFVAAYRPPSEPESVFVWQVAVDPALRGTGLGGRLLDAVLDRPASRGAAHLTTTVTPSNEASDRLFRSFARRRKATCTVADGFAAHLFPNVAAGGADHEAELLYRIGPLSTDRDPRPGGPTATESPIPTKE